MCSKMGEVLLSVSQIVEFTSAISQERIDELA